MNNVAYTSPYMFTFLRLATYFSRCPDYMLFRDSILYSWVNKTITVCHVSQCFFPILHKFGVVLKFYRFCMCNVLMDFHLVMEIVIADKNLMKNVFKKNNSTFGISYWPLENGMIHQRKKIRTSNSDVNKSFIVLAG